MFTNMPTSRWPCRVRPNSPACLIALMVSVPALDSATTCAREAWACSRKEEKSPAFSGCRTRPSTRSPSAFTTASTPRSSA
jgi:hypothetical protein